MGTALVFGVWVTVWSSEAFPTTTTPKAEGGAALMVAVVVRTTSQTHVSPRGRIRRGHLHHGARSGPYQTTATQSEGISFVSTEYLRLLWP